MRDERPMSEAAIEALAQGRHGDPFALLGPQREGEQWVVRALLPGARAVTAASRTRRCVPWKRSWCGAGDEVQCCRAARAARIGLTAGGRSGFRIRRRTDRRGRCVSSFDESGRPLRACAKITCAIR